MTGRKGDHYLQIDVAINWERQSPTLSLSSNKQAATGVYDLTCASSFNKCVKLRACVNHFKDPMQTLHNNIIAVNSYCIVMDSISNI